MREGGIEFMSSFVIDLALALPLFQEKEPSRGADVSFRYVHSWRCTSLMLILRIEADQALQMVGERARLGQIDSPFLYARWYR